MFVRNKWLMLFVLITILLISACGNSDNSNDEEISSSESDSEVEEDTSSGEVDYESAENLVYNELTSTEGSDNISNTTDILGFEVHSFEEKAPDVYYFETDKGEFQLEVKCEDFDDDSSKQALFGKTFAWAVRDWKNSDLLLSSDDWNE